MNSYHYKQLSLLARYTMIAIAITLVIFLVSRDIVLSGKISFAHDFDGYSPFFSELVPKQRVQPSQDGVRILQDPIYTTLSYPRPFQSALLTLEFTNPDGAFMEYGYQNAPGESFELQALNHPQLNLLFNQQDQWSGIAQGESQAINGQSVDLYQKRSAPYIYASVDQFFESLPEQQRTGYYGVEMREPYAPPTKAGSFSLPVPLRGGHRLFISPSRSTIDLRLAFSFLNLEKGQDQIQLELQDWKGNLLATEFFQEENPDNSFVQNDITMRIRSEQVTPEDVLVLVINAGEDTVLTSMEANTPYVVAKGSVRLAGGQLVNDRIGQVSDSIRLYTSARSWVATTNDRSTTQRVYIGPEALEVEKPYAFYRYAKAFSETFLIQKGYELFLEKGGITLTGRGVFGFDQESYFTPYPWYIDDHLQLGNSDIAYVITDYLPPAQLGEGRFSQTLGVELSDVFTFDTSMRTQLSIPNLQEGASPIIHSIRADYVSEPVTWSNAREKAKRFIERLRN